jgi:hypothetical protein
LPAAELGDEQVLTHKHVKQLSGRVGLLALLIALLLSDIFIRRTSAQVTCQSLKADLNSLLNQKTDEQKALNGSSCSGSAKAGCIKLIAQLTAEIAKVQKQLDDNKCPPDTVAPPVTMDVCCGWRVERHPRTTADVNTDGKADVVAFGDDGVWTASSAGNGSFAAPTFALGAFGYNQGWRVDKHVRLLADVNGDKRPDIVGFGDDGVWLALAQPNGGFGPATFVIQNLGVNQGWDPSKHVRIMADINGDGKADIVAFGDDGVWTALSTGTGFSAPTFVLANFGYNQGWRVDKHVRLLADVNGDGRQDIVAFGDDGVWLALAQPNGGFGPATFVIQNLGVNQGWDPSKNVRMMADINGDGKADIVAFGDDGVWTALSAGTGFAAPTFVLANFGYNQGWRVDKHVRLLADVNADGRQDVVAFGDDGVWLALAQPNGGFGPAMFVIQNLGVNQGWDPSKHVRTVGDINGDGKADIVAFGDDGVWTALSTGAGFAAPAFVLADFAYGGQLDVILSAGLTDDNEFARNPVWRQPLPNPCGACPCAEGNTTPQSWNSTAGCTIQSLHANTHTGLGSASYSGLVCAAGGATGLDGLMNWFPAEYEGTVAWGGHSNSFYDDDDYYFTVTRPDGALETLGRDGVHFEFDSDETVDNWDNTNTWWDDFHHNAVDKDDQTARAFVDGKQVIVIGMVALDMEHSDYHSELHPAYAVFVRMPGSTTTQEKVAFFVRNWGDEGFCGPNQEPIPQNTIRVRIRHPWGTGFTLGQNVWVYGDDQNEFNQQSWSYQQVPDGLLLTFSLRDASKKCGFVGDLTINWGTPMVISNAPPTRVAGLPPNQEEDGDPALKAKIDKLSQSDRALLYTQLKNLSHHLPAQAKPGTLGGAPPVQTVGRVRSLPNYGANLKSIQDPARLAQKETQHQFVLSFLKAHGIE